MKQTMKQANDVMSKSLEQVLIFKVKAGWVDPYPIAASDNVPKDALRIPNWDQLHNTSLGGAPYGDEQFYNVDKKGGLRGLAFAANKCQKYFDTIEWNDLSDLNRDFNIRDTMMDPALSQIQGYRSSLLWKKAEPKPLVEYVGHRKLQIHISRLSDTNGKCIPLTSSSLYRFQIIPKGLRPISEISVINDQITYDAATLAVKYPPYLVANIGRQLFWNPSKDDIPERYNPKTLCEDSKYSRNPIGTSELHFQLQEIVKTEFEFWPMYKLPDLKSERTSEKAGSKFTYIRGYDGANYTSEVVGGQFFQEGREYELIKYKSLNNGKYNITYIQLPVKGGLELQTILFNLLINNLVHYFDMVLLRIKLLLVILQI